MSGRIGRIGYINCFPVYGAIDRGIVELPGDLVTGTPNELNDLLAAGELGLSVVSAVEYARNAAEYRLLPDLAISSDGAVRSVLFFARRPAGELDRATVLVSQSSRTSVLLLELLARERWAFNARFVPARAEAPDLSDLARLPHDGVLVIGDAALHLVDSGLYPFCYDLGDEWKSWTGLPFVFAVWAARRDRDEEWVRSVHGRLLESRNWGLSNLGQLAETAAAQTGFSRTLCHEYLSGIDYALGDEHIGGLSEFFDMLRTAGLANPGTLSFLSVA